MCAVFCPSYIKKTIARRREAREAAQEAAREAAQRPAAIRAVGGPRLRPGPWSPVVPSKHVLLYVHVRV